MKINKPLIRKMIKRIETVPEGYFQGDWMRSITKDNAPHYHRPVPRCGTIACLGGEAIICSQPTIAEGIAKLSRVLCGEGQSVSNQAETLMGITTYPCYIFSATGRGWPEPFFSQLSEARTYKGEARAAINLLKAILKTDGKILGN